MRHERVNSRHIDPVKTLTNVKKMCFFLVWRIVMVFGKKKMVMYSHWSDCACKDPVWNGAKLKESMLAEAFLHQEYFAHGINAIVS
jgi:hypothetical protein